MKRLDKLQRLDDLLHKAERMADMQKVGMTTRQKEQWDLIVTGFLQQAHKNVVTVIAKAEEKAAA